MTNRQAAIEIIRKLHKEGFTAVLAGGCVRDMLLGRRASDFDVATDAHPSQISRLFKRTLKVGAKFGVVIVLINDQQVEVATFRTDSGYEDGRHPAAVNFTGAEQDAMRRDFTINAMFYDPLKKKVVDYVNGQADLKNKIVRTVGLPAQRFSEDYLRMIRAVRFSARLGFKIEAETFRAIKNGAKNITRISGERIAMELEAILTDANRAKGVKMLLESGLIEQIFPKIGAENIKKAIKVLSNLLEGSDFALGLAGLFACCDTQTSLDECEILKLSRNQRKHIKFLLENRSRLLNDDMAVSELKMLLAEPCFDDLYSLERAIQKAAGGRSLAAPLNRLRRRIEQIEKGQLRPKPLLDGHQLIKLGAVPGPLLGQLAKEMYIAQLEGQIETALQAKKWVLKWFERHKPGDNG